MCCKFESGCGLREVVYQCSGEGGLCVGGIVLVGPQVAAYLTASVGSLRLPSGDVRCGRGVGGPMLV